MTRDLPSVLTAASTEFHATADPGDHMTEQSTAPHTMAAEPSAPAVDSPQGAPGREHLATARSGPGQLSNAVVRRADAVVSVLVRNKLMSALLLVLLLLIALLATALAFVSPSTPGKRVSLDELQSLASKRQVVVATLRDEDSRVVAELRNHETVWTAYPSTGALTATVEGGGAIFAMKPLIICGLKTN